MMKTSNKKMTIKSLLLAATLLILAGCGGGGSSPLPGDPGAPGAPGGGGTPVTGATLAPLTDPANGGTASASFSAAVAINNAGHAIGYAELAAGSNFKAVLWTVNADGTAASAPLLLNPLAGNTVSAAFGIDGAGNVVGRSAAGAVLTAVLWKAGTADPLALPALPGAAGNSTAFGISPDGTKIAGEAADAAGIIRAVLWRADGAGAFTAAPQVLPVSSFAQGGVLSAFSSANAVNDAGWVVGLVEAGDRVSHAALWRPDAVTGVYAAVDLHTRGDVGSMALAVNAGGQIVGEAEVRAGALVPVLWTEPAAGAFARTDLALAGSASAVNNANRAAGWSGASSLATVWTLPAGTAESLFTTASQVYGINDTNLAVGVNGGKGFVTKVN
jgi:uncharacterized membrane protein